MTTIDVLLPFWGSADLLREAVDSVLAQEDPAWRLTVVDDAYPDPAAAAWVGDLDDDRVRLLRNETNLGVSGSFQRCLDLAEHEWVVIFGCDDRMLPGYVGRMRELVAAHPGVAYVQPGVRVIDAHGRPHLPLGDRIKARYRIDVPTPTEIGDERLTASLLRGNWTYFPSILWNRAKVVRIGFEPAYEIVLDWWLQLELLQQGEQALVDPRVTFEYRRHAVQASTTAAFDASRFHEEKAMLLRMRDRSRARGWDRAARAASWHGSSRLHALLVLAKLWASGTATGTGALLTHALTNRRPPGDWPLS
jgi:glycosyltransferase involved in cell wall biosynthesis